MEYNIEEREQALFAVAMRLLGGRRRTGDYIINKKGRLQFYSNGVMLVQDLPFYISGGYAPNDKITHYEYNFIDPRTGEPERYESWTGLGDDKVYLNYDAAMRRAELMRVYARNLL